MTRILQLSVVWLALTSASCADDERDATSSIAVSRDTATRDAPRPGSSDPLPPNPASEAAPGYAGQDGASISVALAPDGLTIVLADGRTRHLPFGTESGLATTTLSNVIGPAEMSEVPECRLQAGAWQNGLNAYFSEGSFAGWYLGGAADASELTTMAGVTVGSTLSDLTAAYDARRMENSTLGVEYSAGDMAVILSGEGPDARITDLWAGLTCVAR